MHPDNESGRGPVAFVLVMLAAGIIMAAMTLPGAARHFIGV